jgi:hypothetical protein
MAVAWRTLAVEETPFIAAAAIRENADASLASGRFQDL